MTITCNKCGIVNGFIEEKGTQVGLYCNKCGKWIKWLTKDEARLFKHNEAQMLKNEKTGYNHGYAVGYNEAVDDTVKAIKELFAFTILEKEEIGEMARRLKLEVGGNS
nr:MAG TPA: zinc-ribbon domain protein [Caudoviricetes sp.]